MQLQLHLRTNTSIKYGFKEYIINHVYWLITYVHIKKQQKL